MKKQAEPELQNEARAFVEFAKNILAVPKKEVDEQRTKYEKKKEREKEKRTK